MIELGLVLTKHHRLLSVAAILDVFESVNKSLIQHGDPLFNISVIDMGAGRSYPGYEARTLNDEVQYQLILIPAFSDVPIQDALLENSKAFSWLNLQYTGGAELASFCSGAFLLAASGLLDYRPATTHVNAAVQFQNAFPKVDLRASAVVTHKDGIFTSGGATNSFHLMLMLIEKYCSREIAVSTAKYFAIDMNRVQQTYFKSAPLFHSHADELVKMAENEIQNSFASGKNIEELIKDVPASRRNLVRRFKKATGITPIEYLQKLRIETAKTLLEQSAANIQDIMVESGYNDLKTFRMLFKKNVGISPKEYRDKFKGQKLLFVA